MAGVERSLRYYGGKHDLLREPERELPQKLSQTVSFDDNLVPRSRPLGLGRALTPASRSNCNPDHRPDCWRRPAVTHNKLLPGPRSIHRILLASSMFRLRGDENVEGIVDLAWPTDGMLQASIIGISRMRCSRSNCHYRQTSSQSVRELVAAPAVPEKLMKGFGS